MYLDGLEIAGLGVGMVFLALVVMFGATLGLRLTIDKLGGGPNREIACCCGPNRHPNYRVTACLPLRHA